MGHVLETTMKGVCCNILVSHMLMMQYSLKFLPILANCVICIEGLRVCWPVRPEKTCIEEYRSYVRSTKQREAACVTIDSYIQAGIICDVLFCAGQR